MGKNEFWTRYLATVRPKDRKRKVKSIDLSIVVADAEGTLYLTDIQLQEAEIASAHVPANREMLARDRDAQGNPLRKRHFNAVIRGKETIAVPNRENVSHEKDFEKRVTGGMDFLLTATQDMPNGGVQFSHQYRQRTFLLDAELKQGEQLEFSATNRRVTVDGRPTKYSGNYHTCPRGFGIYNVALTKGEKNGSGMLLCEVDMWILGQGGERL